MNFINKYSFILYFLIIEIASSCSSTRNMQVLVARPAVYEMPKTIKKILLVNRTKGNALSIIEGVLSGEVPGTQKIESEQCMAGLQETLNINKDLQITLLPLRLVSDRGISSSFGSPLDWNTIQDLANQNNADAVLVLEFFDTEFSFKDLPTNNQLPDVYVQGTATAKAGFRLYDPYNKTILYERSFSSFRNFTDHSATRALAIAKLIKGSDGLNQVSYSTGESFAKRLIIYQTWEPRLMFKGNSNTQVGDRYVISNNWQEGVDHWLKDFKQESDPQEKGKIAYNLGLGYEVLGDLQEAKKWITISYVEYQNSKAYQYSQIISQRIENEGILEEQRRK